MTSTSTPNSSAHLTCLCGAISAPGSLLADLEIPVPMEICHCNPCRQTTGSLGPSFAPLNDSPSSDTLTKLTPYHSSTKVTRYFCSICGCHCFLLDHPKQEWSCLGGVIEPDATVKSTNALWPKDTIKVVRHCYVPDTLDGGLAPSLLNLNGRIIPTWSASPQDGPFDLPHDTILALPGKSTSTLPPPTDDSFLPAKCHCGGVSLLIQRAKHSPSAVPARHVSTDPAKYCTFLCACRSCRLETGVSLVPWTLVPPANIFNANVPPSDGTLTRLVVGHETSQPDTNPGLTLRHYWSSPDVCWSFCSKCGATVLYWNGTRPKEVDVATGIMRAEEGCMARRWLDWEWGKCGFVQEAVDGEVTQAWVRYRE